MITSILRSARSRVPSPDPWRSSSSWIRKERSGERWLQRKVDTARSRREWESIRSLATASSQQQVPLHGKPFKLSDVEARRSFNNWFQEYVPDVSAEDVNVLAVRPVLVPFYGLKLANSSKRIAVYGGYEFMDQQVEALKIDPAEWTTFNSAELNNQALLLDTWSITAGQAATKAQSISQMKISAEGFQQALLPGYMFEFSRRGQTYKVLVGAQTGKASGLKHFSFLGGVREVLDTMFRVSSFGSRLIGSGNVAFIVLLVLPRLVPPLGLGMLFWGVFRAFLSPVISQGVEKVITRFGRYPDVNNVLARQWGQYDPANTHFDHAASEKQFFQNLFKDFEQAFRQQQEAQQRQYQQFYQQQRQGYRQSNNWDSSDFRRGSSGGGAGGGNYRRASGPTQDEQFQNVDPYQVLGVDRSATPEQLRQAFRKKLLQYHPDHFQGKEGPEFAKRMTQQVVEAYRSLSGSKK